MSTKHTPGPWYVAGNSVATDINDKCFGICKVDGWWDEAEYNSRLIAAAPDMLKVLQSLQPYAEKYLSGKVNDPAVAMWADEHTEQLFTDLLNALARATGEKEVQP